MTQTISSLRQYLSKEYVIPISGSLFRLLMGIQNGSQVEIFGYGSLAWTKLNFFKLAVVSLDDMDYHLDEVLFYVFVLVPLDYLVLYSRIVSKEEGFFSE